MTDACELGSLSLHQDCCSELEAKAAGADHAHTPDAQAEQITRDVSRTRYRIGAREFGAATGEAVAGNITEKQASVLAVAGGEPDHCNSILQPHNSALIGAHSGPSCPEI